MPSLLECAPPPVPRVPEGHRWNAPPEGQVRKRLSAGGRRIRTLGPPSTVSSLHPGARVTTDGANDRICHQGPMPNSGRKRDPLITAETTLIARFNSLQAHPSPAGKEPALRRGSLVTG